MRWFFMNEFQSYGHCLNIQLTNVAFCIITAFFFFFLFSLFSQKLEIVSLSSVQIVCAMNASTSTFKIPRVTNIEGNKYLGMFLPTLYYPLYHGVILTLDSGILTGLGERGTSKKPTRNVCCGAKLLPAAPAAPIAQLAVPLPLGKQH
jgi:hypothetical protein